MTLRMLFKRNLRQIALVTLYHLLSLAIHVRSIHLMSCGLNQDKRSLKVPVYHIRGLHGVRVETFSDASWTLDSLQAALQISIVDGQRALNVLRRPFELCNEHFSSKSESALE